MKTLPGLQDVNSDLQLNSLQLQVEIDRKKASALGITAAQIENTLSYAYGSSQISMIYGPNDQFYVILELCRNISVTRMPCRCSTSVLVTVNRCL
jgi:HAE1 family hydrophobic/amphiphilic exporter-1